MMSNLHFLVKGVQQSRELAGWGADWVEASGPLVSWRTGAVAACGRASRDGHGRVAVWQVLCWPGHADMPAMAGGELAIPCIA